MEITKGNGCPICKNSKALIKSMDPLDMIYFVQCDFCGLIYLPQGGVDIQEDILSSYFFYYWVDHQFEERVFDFTQLTKNWPMADTIHRPSVEDILNWHPKRFSDKVDMILLALSKLTRFYGEKVQLTPDQMDSLFFVSKNKGADRTEQIDFIVDYLLFRNYVKAYPKREYPTAFVLIPFGVQRVDELQKDTRNSKTAFVAMSFSKESEAIRDAIKSGIIASEYEPRLMDEIEHNHQIVPEMLYEIRNSRFVVAELSQHNNGAYYEAGYALGVGKEVIHLCKKEVMTSSMHFDVKQVNTILWESESELSEKLYKRIRATIS